MLESKIVVKGTPEGALYVEDSDLYDDNCKQKISTILQKKQEEGKNQNTTSINHINFKATSPENQKYLNVAFNLAQAFSYESNFSGGRDLNNTLPHVMTSIRMVKELIEKFDNIDDIRNYIEAVEVEAIHLNNENIKIKDNDWWK